ncbi:MBOAT family O-acyltransferase [Butyrivibrio proteoclasticus]|uniref:MBOAT family O-acyltransferase n=1 Tax=Butyrivibrio proteoclasticus TaxID=43305 RepID=UPI00054DEAE1|nr:MBOAT family O-acyltransferase [Butyrivibrio proteoclasticus]
MTVTIASLVFLICAVIVYYVVPKRFRKYFLCAVSLAYGIKLSALTFISVLITGVLAYLGALIIQKLRIKEKTIGLKVVTYSLVALFSLSLLLLKYILAYSSSLFPEGSLLTKVIMPFGYSFYVFQVISYIVDVKRGTTEPSRNPIDVLLYLSFFPKFVSGPIERFGRFEAQIKALPDVRITDVTRWKRAIYYLLYGAFMKLVIADRLGIYVDRVFDGYHQYGFIILLATALAYTIQIYCDFAGYSYIAIGAGLAFGIEIVKNFDMPYSANNITEFWRRWHMSLSSWLTDYLYIPLGGNRKGLLRKLINTMIVFVICGIWHGAGIKFIFWGCLHGTYSAIDSILKSRGVTFIRSGRLGRIITFIEVSFAWVFFKSTSLMSGLKYFVSMFRNGLGIENLSVDLARIELKNIEIIVIIVLTIAITLLDRFSYNRGVSIPELVAKQKQSVRCVVFYLLFVTIMILGIYGPDMGSRLIYMQF